MAYKAVICAVGIYFMEDALCLLKKCACGLHEACLRRLVTKHKSVIVRKIGSYMTWVHAPRLHVTFREKIKGMNTLDHADGAIKCNCLLNENLNVESQSSVVLVNRIEELEKELLRLQDQVSHILLKNDITCAQSSKDRDDSVSPSLPPPPPPPPPLPPAPLVQSTKLLVTVKPKSAKVVAKEDSTANIMEELSKRPPKLRHVERSPGGRPLRSAPVLTDPADILVAVLKKRFEAIHGENQDCYMLNSDNSTKTPMITGH